jgi:hypothetical protein
MKENTPILGGLPAIIRNDHGIYLGDLVAYFRAVFKKAQNLNHPYHNFRHMFHVVWLAYQACSFYRGQLTTRERRNLLIAAMFHDFDHSGIMGDDDLNIARAIRCLEKYIMPGDVEYKTQIYDLIRATEYPYRVTISQVSLSGWILRDADLSQVFSVAWIQQVVFGLAREWSRPPLEILSMQSGFIDKLKYHTEWARATFSPDDLEAKAREARELLVLLEPLQGEPAKA